MITMATKAADAIAIGGKRHLCNMDSGNFSEAKNMSEVDIMNLQYATM